MNYLSHFAINQKKQVSPQFHLGAALPDLMSAINRTLRFQENAVRAYIPHAHCQDVWHGVLNHFEADAAFHGSSFFVSCYEPIRELLKENISPQKNIRPFFLAHIVVEILLDHVLSSNDTSLASRYYRNLERIVVLTIQTDVDRYFGNATSEFTEIFDRFMRFKFLYEYDQIKKMHEPINRMLRRTRQDGFAEHEIADLIAILETCKHIIVKALPEFEAQFMPQG